MTSKSPRKLIEVALPLDDINVASAREKSIRHGHPSTLHLWWARRPLAAARAVLFAQMVNDPGYERNLGRGVNKKDAAKERERLFEIIKKLVQWENTNNEAVLCEAREEIWKSWRETCALNKNHPQAAELFNPDKLPAFHDPFAGGGSIPLEAQRLGLESCASDLNPVAVLINKAMIEIPPKFAGRPPVNPGNREQVTGNREKKENEDRVASGSHRVAEGDGFGGADLSTDYSIPNDRDLPSDLSDHAGSSVSAGQYRGRSRPGDQEGLRSLPLDSQGFPHGDRDVFDARGEAGLSHRGASDTDTLSHHRNQQNAHDPAYPTQHLIPTSSSLSAVPASLFPITYKGAQGLAEDVRYYGQWMRDEAFKRIGHLYPKVRGYREQSTGKFFTEEEIAHLNPVPSNLSPVTYTVIAWLWARTVKSPNPAYSHVEVPLASTFMLSTKEGKEAYVEPVIEGDSYRFIVKVGKPRDTERAEAGTKASGRGASFRCLMSDTPIDGKYIKAEGQAGCMGARLMAIVAEGQRGRLYLSPTPEMEAVAKQASPNWKPSGEVPSRLTGGTCYNYGLTEWGSLFTPRQLVALTTFSDLVQEAREKVKRDALAAGMSDDGKGLDDDGNGAAAYADAVAVYLAFALSRSVDRGSSLCSWDNSPKMEALRNTFGRQAIPMVWDFAEGNPFSESSGNWLNNIEWVVKSLTATPANYSGRANQADATSQATSISKIISTDPPYYDNIGYADLSDFFYVWLRRTLKPIFPGLFATLAVPKAEELIAAPYRHGSKEAAEAFFMEGMTRAMHRLAEQAHPAFPVTIYYAFKQADSSANGTTSTGWETFLEAVLKAGFVLTGTWPMRTELGNRMVGMGTNALASSIVLVCRQRDPDAPTISRREFLRELNAVLPDALDEMTRGSVNSPVAPVDLSQAIIGPGMAIFSKYTAVLEADGTPMSVRTALQLINRFLAEDDFDHDTQFCLHWFETYGWGQGKFGEADVLARAKGTSVSGVAEAGVLSSGKGAVRLLRYADYPTDWSPENDKRTPVWEALHHLIRALQTGGESASGALLAKMPTRTESIRQLAYRLYTLCERKGWAEEARAYNELITSWQAIETAAPKPGQIESQIELDL